MQHIKNTNFGNKLHMPGLKEGLQDAGVIASLSWDSSERGNDKH